MNSNQNTDGDWGSNPDYSLVDTTTVLDTYQYLEITDTSYTNGVAWLSGQAPNSTDYLSRKIETLYDAGDDISADLDSLISYQNDDGGWGYDSELTSLNIDTAIALKALRAVGYNDMQTINNAIQYLKNTQNGDGGWGFYPETCSGCNNGDDSNTYVTALVLDVLSSFSTQFNVQTSINNAIDYLLLKQNPDGGFGSSPSTVYETSLAYLALIGNITDETVLGNAITYLEGNQLPNGSWNDDPYSTALALRALYASENLPEPPPQSTTGTVIGKVVDSETNQPLKGVSIVLDSDPAINTVTDETGSFMLLSVPEGDRSIHFTFPGYNELILAESMEAGSITLLGTVPLKAIPETGIIKGTVTDSESGAPLEGVTVSVTGSYSYSTITLSDGSFLVTDVLPGIVNVTASADGYFDVSGTGTAEAGGTLFFSPQMSKAPPDETTGSLIGRVVDSSTGEPVQSASIMLSGGLSATTDPDGDFIISDIVQGIYLVSVAASGYLSQELRTMIMAGTATDMQTIYLIATPNTTTIAGTVFDVVTGDPVEFADVTVVGSGLSASTYIDGTFSISGLYQLEFDVRVSARGYDSFDYHVKTAWYGNHIVDLGLNPSQTGDLRIASLSADRQVYGAYENVIIMADIENQDTISRQALIVAEIIDADNKVIAISGPDDPVLALFPSSSLETSMLWNTGQFAPGYYRIILKLTDRRTISRDNPTGIALAEKAMVVLVTPAPEIRGAIALDPPVTQADLQTPVTISAAIRNTGNVPLTTGLRVEVEFDGAIVYTDEASLSGFPVNSVMEFEFGSYQPVGGGDYTVRLVATDPTVSSQISTVLYVGPHATATFSVTPEKAVTGNATISGAIHIEGAVSASGQTQDPLGPIIKGAIQKGIYFEQFDVTRWHNFHKCNGCHVQAQALVGAEKSREKVVVDDYFPQMLFDSFKIWQQEDGAISGGENDSLITMTQLGLWALTSWRDQDEAMPYIMKAADYILPAQHADGSWWADGPGGWWASIESVTALSVEGIVQAFRLSGDIRYLDSLERAARYLSAPGLVPSHRNMVRSHQITGLTTILDVLQDENLIAQVEAEIDNAVQTIKSTQRSDGGWGVKDTSDSDSMVTAQVLYALLSAGVSGDDPAMRSAVYFLLNTQGPDGAWVSQNGILGTKYAATTWVMISLPLALERIGGIDVETHVELPGDIDLVSASPLQSDQAGAEYIWKMTAVDESGRDIDLELMVNGLLTGEERAIARDAYISFTSSFTGETVLVPLEIPKVTGISAADINVAIDRNEYPAFDDVRISVTITNNSGTIRTPHAQIFIEDEMGNQVTRVSSFTADDLEPTVLSGWAYRIPADIKTDRDVKNKIAAVDLDFSSILADLGIPDKAIDQNSIRVVELDKSGSLIGIKQAHADFGTASLAKISWLVDGLTAEGVTRYFQIYFDIAENGDKPPSKHTDVPVTGSLIAYSDETGGIYTVENNRDGSFGPLKFIDDPNPTIKDNTRGIVLDDFNGDGYADIVSGSGYDDTIYYYKNRADGSDTFHAKQVVGSIVSRGFIMDMAAADFDNDSNMDFVVSGNFRQIYLFKGHGDGTFNQVLLESPAAVYWLRGKASGDVDNDGNMDFIIANYPDGALYLYLGNGDGTFSRPELIAKNGEDPFGVVIGDFDEDGKKDVITNSAPYNHIGESYLLKGNGDGTFGSAIYIPSLNTRIHSAYDAGDFNNDGHLDVIAANYTKTLELYPGKGNGTFGPKITVAVSSHYGMGISSSPVFGELYPVLHNPESAAVRSYQYIWNTGVTAPGNYKVHVTLLEDQGVIAEDSTAFEIIPDVNINPEIVTDKVTYPANETVLLTSSVTSLSKNAITENLTANISVTDSAGQSIYSESVPVAMLTRGQRIELKTYWNTGQHAAGSYQARLIVIYGGDVISESLASFEIRGTPEAGKSIAGTVAVSPGSVEKGEPVTIKQSVTNIGNSDLNNITVQLLIVDHETQSTIATYDHPVSLALNETAILSDGFDSVTVEPGHYIAVLRVVVDDETLTLGSRTFEVTPPPLPDIQIAASDIVFSNDTPERGDSITISAIVRNAGAEAMNIDVAAYVGDPAVDGVQIGTTTVIPVLGEKGSATVQCTWTVDKEPGTYDVFLMVDPQNVIKEDNELNNSASKQVRVVDKTPPVIDPIQPVPAGIYNSAVEIKAGSTDESSGVDSVEYRLDTGTWIAMSLTDPLTGTYSATWVPTEADEGNRTISFRATDVAGNVSDPVSVSITIDMTPPDIQVISPVAGSILNAAFEVSAASTDDLSGIATVEYRVDEGGWSPLILVDPSNDIYSFTWSPTVADEGMRTITYRATDNAGNESSPVSVTITIDLTPPGPPIIKSPPDGYVSVRSSVNIVGTAEPLSTVDMTYGGFMYSVEASQTGDFVFDGVNLERGDNFFVFTATDMAGNRSGETYHTITYTPVEISEGYPQTANLLVWMNNGCERSNQQSAISDQDSERRSGQRSALSDHHGNDEYDNGGEGHRDDHHGQAKCQGDGEDDDDKDDHHKYCRIDILETLIADISHSYTIVYDRKDFQTELRNPFYTDVLIIGDHHYVEDHYDDELREKVFGGMGIISSRWHMISEYDDDEKKYDPVFGIQHNGTLRDTYYREIETVASPVTVGGEIIGIKGEAVKIEAAEETMIAGMIKKRSKFKVQSSKDSRNEEEDKDGDYDDNDDQRGKKDKVYPGIVLNKYGKGRAVYHAFDIGETLNETNYDQIRDLLGNSLAHVHRTEEDGELYPFGFAGHRIDLKNMAEESVSLRLDITWSPELGIYDPASGLWIEDNPWQIELDVPALDTSSLVYYSFTPDLSGMYSVDADILFRDGSDYTLLETVHQDITVLNSIGGLIDDIVSELALMPKDKDARDIRKHLEEVRRYYTGSQKDLGKAIHECLMALGHAVKEDLTAVRLGLINLLRSLEGTWYFNQ